MGLSSNCCGLQSNYPVYLVLSLLVSVFSFCLVSLGFLKEQGLSSFSQCISFAAERDVFLRCSEW